MAMENFDTFLRTLTKHSHRSCMETPRAQHTYDDLVTEIARWQRRFDDAGIRAGDVVGIQADYSMPAAAALIALGSHRATAALLPRDPELSQNLEDACAAWFLQLDDDGEYKLDAVRPCRSHPLLDRLRSSHEAGLVIFTSGSTGRPKAALHNVDCFLAKFLRQGRSFRTLAFLLFDHVAGVDTLFYTLAAGGTLITCQSRTPSAILGLIASKSVQVLPTSPSFLRMMCASNQSEQFDLSSLKVITYGSEPMDAATLNLLKVRFPDVQIIQKYGSTETGSPRSVSQADDSLWIKLKNDYEVKVIEDVLWVRSNALILGYLNAPSPFDQDGWYCTGDLVEVNGEWIRFLGRATSTINVGGQKVIPAEVERAILEIPFVADAAVTGEPHRLLGYVVAARVVLMASAPQSSFAIKLIRTHCRQRLSLYKVPVKLEVVPEITLTDRQKVKRNLL